MTYAEAEKLCREFFQPFPTYVKPNVRRKRRTTNPLYASLAIYAKYVRF